MTLSNSVLDIALPARPETAPKLRGVLRDYLQSLQLTASATFDVLVAAGEAAGNAIEHAYRDRDGSVRLRAFVEACRLIVEVSDVGRWRTDGDPSRGRGLGIMRALVDHVTIQSSSTGTSVRLELALGTAAKRSGAATPVRRET